MYHIYMCVCSNIYIYIYMLIYIYSLFEKLYIYLFIYSIYSIFIYIPILIFRTSLRLASANIWHRRASACAARPLLLSLFPVCIDLVRPSPENGKLLVGPQHLAFGGIAGSVCRSIYRSICLSINFFPSIYNLGDFLTAIWDKRLGVCQLLHFLRTLCGVVGWLTLRGFFQGPAVAGWVSVWNMVTRHYFHLVGGIPTPLKNMSSSVGMMTFPIYGKIKNVPNHQPVHAYE